MAAPVSARLTRAQTAQIAAITKSWAAPAGPVAGRRPLRLVLAAENAGLRVAAAEDLARRLDRPLQRVDLASIASRHLDETEAALAQLFSAAEAKGAVLLFDEADALMGRRTEVADAHDRYANLDTAFRNQATAYPGILILGTHADAFAAADRPRPDFSLVEWPELPSVAAFTAPLWRRDLRLIRILLLAAERTRPVEIPPEVKTVYPPALIDAHLVLLIEAGLLHGTVYRSGEGWMHATAERLTWAGHDAVASLADDAQWAEAQSALLDGAGRAPFAALLERLRSP